MDQRQQYRQQPSRPQSTSAPTAVAPPKQTTFQPAVKEKPVNNFKKFWWIPLLLILVLAGAWYVLKGSATSQVNSAKYQAVFLNNGQVYFGKLHGFYGDKPYLTDVYYIQAADGTAANADSKEANSTQKLIKLGKEIHGPENSLILNKDSVLFVENLTDESSVVKAIKSDNK